MEKVISKRMCKKVTEEDLRKNGISEENIKYAVDYGYEIWEPVEKDKYIYVYEPDDKEYRFSMEFLSYEGMNEVFSKWRALAG
ncbi:MAG: hypothetical protein K6F77_01950 [Lachnospiraceae bacterium]|nr:hypothetical protein [Lachnospiraceae bacterium]